jgi:hypothetical protein
MNLGGGQSRSGRCGKKEKFLSLSGVEAKFPGRLSRSSVITLMKVSRPHTASNEIVLRFNSLEQQVLHPSYCCYAGS